jgi:hypothetical protein
LPCNVAIYADADATVVAALDPATLIDLTGNPAPAPIATEARDRIARVVFSIPEA